MAMSGLSPIDHLKQANQFTLAIAMIETREALADLDAILAVDGIDGVLVGPSDLSITLTNGATVDHGHPEVLKALKLIAERTRAAGKIAMVFSADGSRAAEMAGLGYHLSSIGTDQLLIRAAARAELGKARAGVTG
jgi:4-hydroxy-2-oxoheptanedioate aldolase